jgi:hypothetical protein
MKNIFATISLAWALGGSLIICAPSPARADADDKPAEAAPQSIVKQNAQGEKVITVDAATQTRIKLTLASLTAASWQPEVKGYGVVLDPTPLATAVMDLATARLNAEASAKELQRTKTLADQNNASSRALEAAHLAAEHDRLAVESARLKFAGDWGPTLASRDDLPELVQSLAVGKSSLIRVILPAGEHLKATPLNTTLTVFPNDTDSIPVEPVELNGSVDPQTQGQTYLFLAKNRGLPWGTAVTGRLGFAGKPLAGVLVPATAILRHDGLGWIYLQSASDQFTRHEIPLDRLTKNGWFVAAGLSTTNQVVVGGAETLLSAELSGGGFNTGTRD